MLTKIYLFSPDPLHVYSEAVKKEHLTIKRLLCTCDFTTLVLICTVKVFNFKGLKFRG